MRPNAQCLIAIFSIAVFVWPAFSADFRVFPYIQNPTTASMSILWFSNDDTPGRLTYRKKGTSNDTTIVSTPYHPIAREHRYIYFNRLKSTIQLGDTHGRLL
jgi:hypothetical protein